MSTDDENPQLKVHKIGPLISYCKPYGKRSTLFILKTDLQEYQLDSKEFSKDYSDALKNARYVENFFGSLPQNNVSQQTVISSPVTTVTNHDLEIIDLDEEPQEIVSKGQKRHTSDDEDDSPVKKSKSISSKKSKTKSSPKSRDVSKLDSSYSILIK